jgi:glycogen debranching enzyme
MHASKALIDRAVAVLRRNDAGRFVKPGPDVYPFQWNWDSAFVAIGLARIDPARGREEIRSLLHGSWADGMVPHMVFHEPDQDYSPGPELWESSACTGAPAVATSGITQPPVAATAVRALHEAEPDRGFLQEVLPALEAWHDWLHRARRFDRSGLLAILHPWESADDAPRFDRALARLETAPVAAVDRSDRRHVAAAERPTDLDYLRFLALVERLRAQGYRPNALTDTPFAYADLTFNSVLAAAESDLAWLLREIGEDGTRAESASALLREALAARWDEREAGFRELDLHGDEGTLGDTVGDLLPLYAGVPTDDQARRLVDERLWSPERHGPSPSAPWAVTSVSKASRAFDPRRYWRGPVWVNLNWFLIRGLVRYGLDDVAEELRGLTLSLVATSGFAEYYHPSTGEPLGSRDFSWSAALTLDLVA